MQYNSEESVVVSIRGKVENESGSVVGLQLDYKLDEYLGEHLWGDIVDLILIPIGYKINGELYDER